MCICMSRKMVFPDEILLVQDYKKNVNRIGRGKDVNRIGRGKDVFFFTQFVHVTKKFVLRIRDTNSSMLCQLVVDITLFFLVSFPNR